MKDNPIFAERVGVLLEPELADEREVEGILNPAVAGNYLLYRAVGRNNYSRVMAAELTSEQTEEGTSVSARKLHQVVLEPEEEYEKVDDQHGGIEDPRITTLSDGTYVMFYTGFGRPGGFTDQVPLVALATSNDGIAWQRQGRITFAPYDYKGKIIDFNIIPNKDTVLFSEQINGRHALLYRPMFTHEQAKEYQVPRRAIWYAESDTLAGSWEDHRILLEPKYEWEHGGVGAGVPPIHLKDEWLHVYHGISLPNGERTFRQYNAGVFLTSHNDPQHIIFRSDCVVIEPTVPEEMTGTVPYVVFPTAVWQQNNELDNLALFWGAADTKIVWGVLHLPGKTLKPYNDIRHV